MTDDPATILAVISALERINAEAEQDMLNGNPVTGAHHRAIERELSRLRADLKAASAPEERMRARWLAQNPGSNAQAAEDS